eukprot:scaffold10095_cov68-Cylindrotheca_fusiformis.AAC.3
MNTSRDERQREHFSSIFLLQQQQQQHLIFYCWRQPCFRPPTETGGGHMVRGISYHYMLGVVLGGDIY